MLSPPLMLAILVAPQTPADTAFDRFSSWALSRIPERGSIILHYAHPQIQGQTGWAGFDFASGAAFRISHGTVMSVDPSGLTFTGRGYPGLVKPQDPAKSQGDSVIDYFIPAVFLRGLARDRDSFVSGEPTPDGGWNVTYRFIEGQRGFTPDNLPGGRNFPRKHALCHVTIDPTGQVQRIEREGFGVPWTAEYAPDRQGGVAVAARWGDMILAGAEFIPEGDPSRFLLPSVERLAVEAKTDAYKHLTIDTTADQAVDGDALTPTARSVTPWARATTLVGVGVVALGAAVWWYRRRA